MIIAFSTFIRSKIFPAILILMLTVSAQAAETLNATPAVWLIEKGASKTYFLGSVHLLPDDVKWYGNTIEDIIENADEIVFEVHMTPQMQAKAQQITLANGMLSGGDSLRNYLSVEEYAFVVEQAKASGIPPAVIANFQPWFASIALSVSAIIKQGWNPESGVDKYIESVIAKKNIKISELETLEAQMATLYDHPLEVFEIYIINLNLMFCFG